MQKHLDSKVIHFFATVCTANQLPPCLYFPHAEAGDAVQLQHLLQSGADVNGSCYKARVTPLHLACRAGHLETVEVLLAAGADVEATTTGTTHWAASGDRPFCACCRYYYYVWAARGAVWRGGSTDYVTCKAT